MASGALDYQTHGESIEVALTNIIYILTEGCSVPKGTECYLIQQSGHAWVLEMLVPHLAHLTTSKDVAKLMDELVTRIRCYKGWNSRA